MHIGPRSPVARQSWRPPSLEFQTGERRHHSNPRLVIPLNFKAHPEGFQESRSVFEPKNHIEAIYLGRFRCFEYRTYLLLQESVNSLREGVVSIPSDHVGRSVNGGHRAVGESSQEIVDALLCYNIAH